MPSNKKPQRRYHRGKVIAGAHLPLPALKRKEVVIKALMAVQALVSGFYNQAMGLDLVLFLVGCRRLVKGNSEAETLLAEAFRTLNRVKDQHTATGEWVIEPAEATSLASVVSACVELYESLSVGQAMEATLYAETLLVRKRLSST